MKKLSFLLILVFVTITNAQVNKFSDNELTTLCKVWGAMKYYHPSISQGKLDWDDVLVKTLENPKKENVDIIISNWFNQANKIAFETKNPLKFDCDSITNRNFKISWITQDKNIKKVNQAQLLYLLEHPKNIGTYYTNSAPEDIKFKADNEKTYTATSSTLKMLDLFRVWNVIQYFYPYKYLMDKNWETTLNKYIPLFRNCASELEYKKLITLLSAEIQDTHVHLKDNYNYEILGNLSAPFTFQIVNDGAVITKIKDEKIAKESNLAIGDFITKIDNESIPDIIKKNKKYVAASNESVAVREAFNYLFSSNDPVFEIDAIKPDGTKLHTAVKRIQRNFIAEWDKDGIPDYHLNYKQKDYNYLTWNDKESRLNPVFVLENKVYIEFSNLPIKEIDSTMKSIQNAKGIVFDLRGYNQDGRLMKVFDYLFSTPQFFGIKTHSDFNQPGKFCFEDNIINKHYKLIGKNNPSPYKGQVIILINEYTQSSEELWAMLFKKVPNVIFVGSQTAGADGNETIIKLTNSNELTFSGLGIYYPNGEETQRIGIKPDSIVRPTLESIRKKEDLLLLKAFEIIDNK